MSVAWKICGVNILTDGYFFFSMGGVNFFTINFVFFFSLHWKKKCNSNSPKNQLKISWARYVSWKLNSQSDKLKSYLFLIQVIHLFYVYSLENHSFTTRNLLMHPVRTIVYPSPIKTLYFHWCIIYILYNFIELLTTLRIGTDER